MPRTHPLNTTSLVVGLLLIGLSGLWLIRHLGLIDASQTPLVLPVLLVVAGALGLVAFLLRGVNRRRADSTEESS